MRFHCLNILWIALLCSCAPLPPKDIPHYSAHPKELVLSHASGFAMVRDELVFENGYLVLRRFKVGDYGDKLISKEYYIPSQDQWLSFWKEANRLQLWHWKKQYRPEDIGHFVCDGSDWHFVAKYQDKIIDTSGDNAGPKPGQPEITVTERPESEINDLVSILLKK